MHIHLHNQPIDGPFIEKLRDSFDSSNNAVLVSAFAQSAGVLAIKEKIISMRSRGGNVVVIVGIDLGGTSYEALKLLNECVDELYVYHDENNGRIFHPKLYLTYNDNFATLAVGSNNLTRRGLFKNVESSIIVELELNNAEDENLLDNVVDYIAELKARYKICLKIDDNVLQELFDNGYVIHEIDQTKIMSKKIKFDSYVKMFGSTSSNNSVEFISGNTKLDECFATDTPRAAVYFWFETGRMTGGSRNILDVSKTGLVLSGDVETTPYKIPGKPNMMMGGVSFFGINPDTTVEKDIKINFNGVDYLGNTIKIETEGKKPNKSWRIQLKGESLPDNDKIYQKINFVEKIVLFQEIDVDYYSLEVYGIEELDHIMGVSRLVASNGGRPNSRKYGVLYFDDLSE